MRSRRETVDGKRAMGNGQWAVGNGFPPLAGVARSAGGGPPNMRSET